MVGVFIYNIDLTVINNMDSLINPMLTSLVLGKPFVKRTEAILDEEDGSISFTDGVRNVIFRDGKEEVYEYQPQSTSNIKELLTSRHGRIEKRDSRNLKIPCMIDHKHFYNVYIDVGLTMNVMSLFHYNNLCRWGLIYKGESIVGRDDDVQVFVGNMTFTMSFTTLIMLRITSILGYHKLFLGHLFMKSLT